jgi:tRNA pseudouridine38-40 synthase
MFPFALLLAYDGTGFAGWWRQPGLRTVAGTLDEALIRLGEPDAAPVGASRTDAGVHARGQVAHAILRRAWEPADLLAALAHQLPDDCRCLGVAPVAPDWHACHAATAKTYSYAIDTSAAGDAFRAAHAWRPPFRLDLAALQAASARIPGRRDWRAFVRRGDHREEDGGTVRRIDRVQWRAEGDLLVCTVDGEGFIYRLVRSLVGAMTAVARGACSAADLDAALAGGDSPAGREQAPARGLCLERVHYAREPAWIQP